MGGITKEQSILFDMSVDGAKINALVSAGGKATDLPTLGIGVNEWHTQAGFDAKDLAALAGTWPDLLAMGFTASMMFRYRMSFGPHLLAIEPFNVTLEILMRDTDETLETLVRTHHASSSDLSLLGMDWNKFLRYGGDQALVVSMEESISGMESNFRVPHGMIEKFINPSTESAIRTNESTRRPPTRPMRCKSFVM